MVARTAGKNGCPPLSNSAASVHARTLHRACELLGGMDTASRHFGVPPEALARWIGGVEDPPLDIFLKAVDVVLLGVDKRSDA